MRNPAPLHSIQANLYYFNKIYIYIYKIFALYILYILSLNHFIRKVFAFYKMLLDMITKLMKTSLLSGILETQNVSVFSEA